MVDDSKEKVIQKYIDDSKYGDYLINLLTIMSSNTDQIVQDWKTYKDSFILSSGNSNSSSLNMITNDFVYYFEKGLRANKIGIPAGVYSGEIHCLTELKHTIPQKTLLKMFQKIWQKRLC